MLKRRSQAVEGCYSLTKAFVMIRRVIQFAYLSTAVASGMNLNVKGAGSRIVNGMYVAKAPTQIPAGFTKTCDQMGWDSERMWKQLSNQVSPWWKHSDNESYIYYNRGDGQWWIDDPSGAGLYVALVSSETVTSNMPGAFPPVNGWELLGRGVEPEPSVEMITTGISPP